MSNFNEHKIYRVRQVIDTKGNTAYIVEAADSWLAGFFGLWTEYLKKNLSVGAAIEQIKELATYRRSVTEVVFRTHISDLN